MKLKKNIVKIKSKHNNSFTTKKIFTSNVMIIPNLVKLVF